MNKNAENKSHEEISEQNMKTAPNRSIAKGVCFGMLAGSAFMSISMAMGHIAIGMFGPLFGMLFGAAFGHKKQKNEAENDKNAENNGEE